MQKLADGHDTDVRSDPPRVEPRRVRAPHVGAAPDCAVAGWPAAGEPAPGLGGAEDDPVHPVTAPMSRMDAQASAGHSRPVTRGALVAGVLVSTARQASVISPLCLAFTAGPSLFPFRYPAS